MAIENAEAYNIDLSATDNHGRSGLKLAQCWKKHNVVDLIKRKLPELEEDLSIKLRTIYDVQCQTRVTRLKRDSGLPKYFLNNSEQLK